MREAPTSSSHRSERGATLVIFALVLTLVLIPVMGLGVDYTLAYMARIRLMSAADAAALAGCRAFSSADTSASQLAGVQQMATQYFDANFPAGYLNSTVTRSALALIDNNSYRKVTVTAQATVPTTFLSFLGTPSITLQQSATTSRRNVALMLVLDRSGSMSQVCGTLRTTAINFVNGFADGLDNVGLASFMAAANLDASLSSTFKSNVTGKIQTLACGGATGTAHGLTLALSQFQGSASLTAGMLKVIVLFTDGEPNGYTSTFYPSPSNSSCYSAYQNGLKAVIGFQFGMFSYASIPINSTSQTLATSSSSNCAYSVNTADDLKGDFPLIPAVDLYGNYGDSAQNYTNPTRDGNGNIPMSYGNGQAVSTNAATYAAYNAKQQGIRVYTIGLDGNGGLNSDWLTYIANDPAGPKYSSSQPAGRYAYAANASQLQNAFNTIKSEILRISQ